MIFTAIAVIAYLLLIAACAVYVIRTPQRTPQPLAGYQPDGANEYRICEHAGKFQVQMRVPGYNWFMLDERMGDHHTLASARARARQHQREAARYREPVKFHAVEGEN